jgi:MYXO-CTERM domain-containing protein
VTSVCSGAVVLAAAGLLGGRRATTHGAECGVLGDTDADVTVDPLDTDDDGDGLLTAEERAATAALGSADPDADGAPAWRDLDSDGDGAPDGVDSDDVSDADGDGRPDLLDDDSDSVPPVDEPPPPADDPGCFGAQTPPAPLLALFLLLGAIALRRRRPSLVRVRLGKTTTTVLGLALAALTSTEAGAVVGTVDPACGSATANSAMTCGAGGAGAATEWRDGGALFT